MQLKDKVINFLGDSITEGVGVADRKNNRYDNVIKREYGLKAANNYGIGGTRLAHQFYPSENPRFDLCFCGRAYVMDEKADIVVVYGGVNDYIHGDAPIGKMGDKTPATFYGAVYFLMNFLKTTYAGKPVVFMTPAHCNFRTGSDSAISNHPSKKEDAMPLIGYINIIEETAKLFDIPVLNLYNTLGIDPNNPDDKAKYTADGLHFNDEGQAHIAKRLGEFLLAL
ncbi:MAG: SGNH/GDSL hydrolase family protein [Clostridia bacterium]|nr:SGNH/GDSL hydrolase family protein [Clostridia bacterium]